MRRDAFGPSVEQPGFLYPWDPGPQSLLRDHYQAPGARRQMYPGVGIPAPGPVTSSPIGPVPEWIAEAHRYAYPLDQTFAYTAASQQALAAPTTFRNYLALRNLSATQTVYIAWSGIASNQVALQLPPGGFVLFDTVVPQHDMNVAGTGAGTLAISVSTVLLPTIPPPSP